VDGRFDIPERVVSIVPDKAVQRSDAIKLESHTAGFIDGPVEQVGLAMPDSIKSRQNVKARITIELRREDVALQC
jgi:hypothetical protein